MSYLALYRKYRPTNFDDLVGQEGVSSIIKNEIINNKISHAYLFSGPRGTGKTSSAKIFAKMINCSKLGKNGIPCGKCESCLNFNSSSDIVEIDAASNNGVDEIRELRDKVNLVPTYGKYKVYIIDEVHMLTTQAFNALLKTLEEPPSHVVFILATTEFYKIPITVVSRCQKFQFFKFSDDNIYERLSFIAKSEKISVDNYALREIARLSDGGMRDAINMLDQLSSFCDGKVSVDDVYLLNGVSSYVELFNLTDFIINNNVLEIVNFIEELDRCGKSFDRFVNDYIILLKDILLFKSDSSFSTNSSDRDKLVVEFANKLDFDVIYSFIMVLNDLLSQMKNSNFSKVLLIVELIKFSNNSFVNKNISENKNVLKENYQVVNQTKDILNSEVSDDNKAAVKINEGAKGISDKVKIIRINNAFATASKDLKEEFNSKWDIVLDKLSNDVVYDEISLMMRDVKAMVVGINNIIFLAPYESLIDRLIYCNELIEKLLFEVYNIEYKFVFLVNDEWNFEKEKYIASLKEGIKFKVIDEEVSNVIDKKTDDNLDILLSIFGNDVVSYD